MEKFYSENKIIYNYFVLVYILFETKNKRLSEMKRKKDVQRQERMKQFQGVNVYIKNLDNTIDDEQLKKEFSKFGTITSAKLSS